MYTQAFNPQWVRSRYTKISSAAHKIYIQTKNYNFFVCNSTTLPFCYTLCCFGVFIIFNDARAMLRKGRSIKTFGINIMAGMMVETTTMKTMTICFYNWWYQLWIYNKLRAYEEGMNPDYLSFSLSPFSVCCVVVPLHVRAFKYITFWAVKSLNLNTFINVWPIENIFHSNFTMRRLLCKYIPTKNINLKFWCGFEQ